MLAGRGASTARQVPPSRRKRQVSPALEQLAKSDPEVALRKIDIIDWTSAVARQYNVTSIPRVEVYGRKGQLVGTVRGANPDQVRKYVAQAKGG